jgi:hypothetical protein
MCDSSISDSRIVWKTASHIFIAIQTVAAVAVPPAIATEGVSAGESELAMYMYAELNVYATVGNVALHIKAIPDQVNASETLGIEASFRNPFHPSFRCRC